MSPILSYRNKCGLSRREFIDELCAFKANASIQAVTQIDYDTINIVDATLRNYELGERHPNRDFLMVLTAFFAHKEEITNRMEANRFVVLLIQKNETPGLSDQEFITYVQPYLDWEDQHRLSIEYRVQDCQADLMATLARIPDDQKVLMQLLSLNLWIGWSALVRGMETLKHKNVEIQALSMSGNPDDMGKYIPEKVTKWSSIVDDSLDEIRESVHEHGKNLKVEDKRIRLELRQYRVMPFIQGFRIVEPAEFAVTYLSFCRWIPPTFKNYDWGEYNFLQIKPNDIVSPNEYERYILELFESTYQHHWLANPEPVIKYDNFG